MKAFASQRDNSQVIDAETGQRGYLITGDQNYLEPYTAARKATRQDFQALRQLSLDQPSLKPRLDTLENLIALKYQELEQTINLRCRREALRRQRRLWKPTLVSERRMRSGPKT